MIRAFGKIIFLVGKSSFILGKIQHIARYAL
jgi:hypothetical protein